MSDPVLAWHFVGATLRDGRRVPADGVKLVHEGPVEMCASGLHASERILDALDYAPGETACRVECGGCIRRDDDKLVCTERTILWRVDASGLLREFARQCALDVAHLWNAPEVVLHYLRTGDDAARDAAWAAAWVAARAAAGAAAWAAAGAAAEAAAEAAARNAARAAAGAAARDAARNAAQDAQNERLQAMVERAHAEAASHLEIAP